MPDRPAGAFSFFLHGHLPWVLSHGRWPHGAEWLCEAAIETYLPLVRGLRRLRAKGIGGGVTLSVSPVLAEQLAAAEFRRTLADYLDDRIETSRDELLDFENRQVGDLAELAKTWEIAYRDTREYFFETLGGDLLAALRDLEESGTIELATCGATHGYLPLLGCDESIELQIELACRVHERHFGRAPRGIWLPEAAYRPGGPWRPSGGDGETRLRPGVEEFLSRAGLRYFIVDSGLLRGGPGIGAYPERFREAPLFRLDAQRAAPPRPASDADTHRSHWVARDRGKRPDVAFFTRDPSTALQVWSGENGYPGDPLYLEFHKKSDTGGHRYWKITGPDVDLGSKEMYSPQAAASRIGLQADHFRTLVRQTLEGAGHGSILVAPYDAELFGHWWYEGIAWIEGVLERLHEEPGVHLTTLDRHVAEFPPEDAVRLPEGSWGEGGHHYVWSNPQVDWAWQLIYPSENEVWSLSVDALESDREDARRIARAAMRQLLLLMASDWPFLITTGTAVDYATERLRRHADDVARLVDLGRRVLEGHRPDPVELRFVDEVERRDELFPELEDAVRTVTGRERVSTPRG